MIQLTTFGYSKKLFALDPASFTVTPSAASNILGGNIRYIYEVQAVWFGRRKATQRRAAFMGSIRLISPHSWNYQEFMDHIESMPYGSCWDGEEVWGTTKFYEQQTIVNYLDPILKAEPNLPPGFDGWFEILK